MNKRSSFKRPGFFLFFLLFSYSYQLFAKTIIISDIDDTIKKSNSAGRAHEQVYHFLKKVPYLEMRDLFLELKSFEKSRGEDTRFYYVSAAKDFTFNAQPWLSKHNFPNGRSTLKSFKEKRTTYDFKYAVIKAILEEEAKSVDLEANENFNVYMFGDNAQVDAEVYARIARELNLKAHIYIRDVQTYATYFEEGLPVKKVPGVNYYFSEIELFKFPELFFISAELLGRSYDAYKKRVLIPEYTYTTLYRRVFDIHKDKKRAKEHADRLWNSYYSQF